MKWSFFWCFIFCLVAHTTFAQTDNTVSSNYIWNWAAINPAALGTSSGLQINTFYRRQWSGVEGAPVSFYALAEYNPNAQPHAIGLETCNERAGLWQQTAIFMRYAYHLTLNQTDLDDPSSQIKLSFGTSLGLKTIGFDASRATLFNPNDRVIQNNQQQTIPDANVGMWLHSKHFFGGFGIYQLFENNTNFGGSDQIRRYYQLAAGGHIPLAYDLTLSPSARLLIHPVQEPIIDLNTRLDYQNLAWVAASYKHERSVQAFLGIQVADWLHLAYSYEWARGVDDNAFFGNTNEIMLGISLFNSQTTTTKQTSIYNMIKK